MARRCRLIPWITVAAATVVAVSLFITNKVVVLNVRTSSSITTTTDVHQSSVQNNYHNNNGEDNAGINQKRSGNNPNVTIIVVDLPEALGRALDVLAAARAVQSFARDFFGIETHLLLRAHDESRRGRLTSQELQSCFPNLLQSASFVQNGSSIDVFSKRIQKDFERWDKNSTFRPFLDLSGTKEEVVQTLKMLHQIQSNPGHDFFLSSNATISLPFLRAHPTFDASSLIDSSNIDDIRYFLTFHQKNCCSSTPKTDETVLAIQQYNQEGIGSNSSRGQVIVELLRHLSSGSKVAIVSAVPLDDTIRSALFDRGLQVRTVQQSNIRDFCFLIRAKKELIIETKSSHAVWAATLNTEVRSIWLYSLPEAASGSGSQNHPVQPTRHVRWLPSEHRIQYVCLEQGEMRVLNCTDETFATVENPISSLQNGQVGSPAMLDPTANLATMHPTTIVVQLSGEMGNNLGKLATGKGLQLLARRNYGIETTLVLRHQDSPKWVRGMKDIKKCFPKLRHFDFELGNSNDFLVRSEQQNELLGYNSGMLQIGSADIEYAKQTLSTLRRILQDKDLNSTVRDNFANITVPFLLADYQAWIDAWVDMFYDEYRQFFEFDYENCCKEKPYPDEAVFHFRNFATEMPRNVKIKGYEELSPNNTANELFRNLQTGDKVAITSRYSADPSVQRYVDAFAARGIQTRVITGQSGVEDFCFLLSAKKELVGYSRSTFAIWAGYLGNADRVRLYSVDSPARGTDVFPHRFNHFNWTNAKLRDKVFFEQHELEDEG